MTQKRHGTKSASKSSQSTLSFNGRSSKVTKPIGSHAGKDVLSHTEDVDTENLEKRLKPKSNTKPLKLLNRETQEAVSSKSDSPEPESKSEKIAEPENAEEALARKITDREIVAYWQKKESERRAPRVHQADLNVHEKILREWDMSGQYGVSLNVNSSNNNPCSWKIESNITDRLLT